MGLTLHHETYPYRASYRGSVASSCRRCAAARARCIDWRYVRHTTSRTIPVKVEIFANGVEQSTGSLLSVVGCGGGTPMTMPLSWDGTWSAISTRARSADRAATASRPRSTAMPRARSALTSGAAPRLRPSPQRRSPSPGAAARFSAKQESESRPRSRAGSSCGWSDGSVRPPSLASIEAVCPVQCHSPLESAET